MPCRKEETGYRVFDNVFAIDRKTDDSVVVIRYMHSMLRDQETYHSRCVFLVFVIFNGMIF